MKFYFGSLVNLASSNLFQLNFIVKDVCIYGGQSKEGREKLLSIFKKAIKFDYQFSAILYTVVLFWFLSFIFDKLAHFPLQ